MWQTAQKTILTKDDMLRRWQGNTGCYFCDASENVDHLFFEFHFKRFILLARGNKS
jgi:hypothetical protein